MLSKRDKKMSISDTAFMKERLPLVFDKRRYGSVKAAQIAAYDFLKPRVTKELKLRRIRQLWEGRATRVDGEEKDALRLAEIEEAKNEQVRLRARLSQVDALLASLSTSEAGEALATRGASQSTMGRSDSAGNCR